MTEPRKVVAGWGRDTPIVEVKYRDKRYTLYLSWVDLLNRLAILEQQCDDKGESMKGQTIVLERTKKYRFSVRLAY
ncbi:MAG: hypothetical protein OK452_02525, partial [Thaumarchaeota archaeon]|nr:hypothetical protein [Nitrososphaerota archaeon]